VVGVEGDITWGNLNGTNASAFGPDTFTISRAFTACSATIWMRAQRQSGWPFWRSRREDDCRGATITQAISW
jgi:hypothetical protein